jgi:hypothetical protein
MFDYHGDYVDYYNDENVDEYVDEDALVPHPLSL